jgi:sentrin-specific protease 1
MMMMMIIKKKYLNSEMLLTPDIAWKLIQNDNNIKKNRRFLRSKQNNLGEYIVHLEEMMKNDEYFKNYNKFGEGNISPQYKKLLDGNWIDGKTISQYLRLLTQNPFLEKKKICFYEILEENDIKDQKVFIYNKHKRNNIFEIYDEILWKIFVCGNHFILLIINISEKHLKIFDSLNYRYNDLITFINNWWNLHCDNYYPNVDHQLKSKKWKITYMNCPKQDNCDDCGVFVCMFCDYYLDNLPMDFKQKDIKYFRSKIMRDLLDGSLHYYWYDINPINVTFK